VIITVVATATTTSSPTTTTTHTYYYDHCCYSYPGSLLEYVHAGRTVMVDDDQLGALWVQGDDWIG